MKLPTPVHYPEIFFFEDLDFDENSGSLSETIKVGAFVESVSRKERVSESDDVPFSNLLKTGGGGGGGGVGKQANTNETKTPEQTAEAKEDSDNGNVSPRSLSHDDFIMKTPFAGSNANTDLGLFYRECQSAPQLEGFGTEPTVAEQVGDLTRQLEAFEVSLKEYDNVITELYASDNNN